MEIEDLEFLIITGMSGAGKSETIHFLEDRGYFCIDNLPAILLTDFTDIYKKSKGKITKLAFVIDTRDKNLTGDLEKALSDLKSKKVNYKILFLDARDEILLNRFNLTRRKHPIDEYETLIENIRSERKKLEEVRKLTSFIIDTSDISAKGLVTLLEGELKDKLDTKLTVTFTSYGFKYGSPIDLDLMFDLRFLPNPYYIPEIKELTGNNKEVQEYIMKFEESQIFYNKLKEMLEFLFPRYIKEGKSYLTIGLGCSGGKHRSVTFANKLYEFFNSQDDYKTLVTHRDIIK